MILPAPSHEITLADWTHSMSRSVLRQMIAITARPGILSFAGGLPDPALFPTADYAAALQHVLAADPKALQYGPPLAALKVHIVGLMAERGVEVTPEQVFLTTGAQQGLDILTRLFLNPGGEVLLEEIVYPGIQQTVAPYRPHILPIPTDLETGIDVDTIEQVLADGARPAFLYVIPDAHNPLGVSISPDKRQRLVSLARAYGLPIIEDDPYGFLHYDSHLEPPLRAFDDEWVFYLGSFSKILAPALRLGWMIAPEPLIPKLTVVKEAGDLESSALTQRAVAAYLDAGHLPAHLEKLRREYGHRRDTMLQALYHHFPTEARWTVPSGGMFVWVELAAGVDTKVVLETAVSEAQVAFIPGAAFTLPGRTAPHCLRLNFSNCTPDRIEEGIARLAEVINRG
ncbi:MAG: PLP-dependent aminotransferase family protein [Ardenticatenaceae bacterium]|nr:PLP-dependent aminotransferase family protein [Ardenticatenaceae bacterium]MCB8987031.1 PLP-dependent aminotransferase family protein [Ardenticatenaceae bacterium]